MMCKGALRACSHPWATALLDLPLDLRDVTIEYSGALCLSLAWLVGASMSGALEESWWELDHRGSPLGIAGLVRSWTIAVPLFAVAKALGIAGVLLPLGAGLHEVLAQPLSWPGLTDDLVGMLLATMLCRRLLLHRRGIDV